MADTGTEGALACQARGAGGGLAALNNGCGLQVLVFMGDVFSRALKASVQRVEASAPAVWTCPHTAPCSPPTDLPTGSPCIWPRLLVHHNFVLHRAAPSILPTSNALFSPSTALVPLSPLLAWGPMCTRRPQLVWELQPVRMLLCCTAGAGSFGDSTLGTSRTR